MRDELLGGSRSLSPVTSMKRRLVARLSTEYVLRRVNRIRSELFDGDLVLTLVYAAVIQANARDVDADEHLSRQWGQAEQPLPVALRKPVSGYAVALALGLPRETVRRKIKVLVERQLLEPTEAGFIGAQHDLEPEYGLSFMESDAAMSLAFFQTMQHIEGLSEQDLALCRQGPCMQRMISRAANGHTLAVLEDLRRLFDGELIAGLLFCAILNANARRAGGGGAEDLQSRWENARPITALALSDMVGIPRETTRRHIKKLEEMGFCTFGTRGVTISEDVLGKPSVVAAFDRICASTRALIQRMARSGVLADREAQTA
jgi:predicted transcriptional regulator